MATTKKTPKSTLQKIADSARKDIAVLKANHEEDIKALKKRLAAAKKQAKAEGKNLSKLKDRAVVEIEKILERAKAEGKKLKSKTAAKAKAPASGKKKKQAAKKTATSPKQAPKKKTAAK